MRIVLAAEGTRGDIHPMLALARTLAGSGHEVRLCAPPDFAEDAAQVDVPFTPVGESVRTYLDSQAHMLHGSALRAMNAGRKWFVESIERSFRDLRPAAEGAELVLYAGVQFAASSVAEAVGAPSRMIAYCPSLLRSSWQTPFAVPRGALRPWQNRAAWWFVTRFMGTLRPLLDRERAKLGLGPVGDLYSLLCGDRPFLAAEEILAPPPADWSGAVRVLGCLHPFDARAPLPEKLEAFLDAGEPPVYVGFGSMTDPDPRAATRLILDAVARAGVRAVLSAGWAGLGDAALPSDVMVIGPVSHAALFRSVSAVIHHGGAGTTTMAARAGAPQILVPHILDQYHWAHRVARLGLGPPALRRRGLDAERLAQAIRALRDNDLVSERAAEIGGRLREAMRTRAHPAELILDFAA